MPANVVTTGTDEARWARAKAAAAKQGKAKNYALVMHIYKQMTKAKDPDEDEGEAHKMPIPGIPASWNKGEILTGGEGDKRPDSDFDATALKQGIKVEFEHTTSRAVAKEIAKDHLTEDPQYYKKLATIEKAFPGPAAPPAGHAAGGAQIGEVHDWGRGKMRKVAPGKWEPVTGPQSGAKQQPTGPEPATEGTADHHRQQALVHTQAAMAHAVAHQSAKEQEEAAKHDDNVREAKEASQEAYEGKDGRPVEPQSLEDKIKALMEEHGQDAVAAATSKAAKATAAGLDKAFQAEAKKVAGSEGVQAAAGDAIAAAGIKKGGEAPSKSQVDQAVKHAAQDPNVKKAARDGLKALEGPGADALVSGLEAAVPPEEKKKASWKTKAAAVAKMMIRPFVFGFVDNFVMYVAGSAVDGAVQGAGFSSAATAGIGNAISDAVGETAGGLLERALPDEEKLKAELGKDTYEKMEKFLQPLGVFTGALLGMIPLAFGVSFGKSMRREMDIQKARAKVAAGQMGFQFGAAKPAGGGEGSRGGEVVGHTASGKAIYKKKVADHEAKAKEHATAAAKATDHGVRTKHLHAAKAHQVAASAHRIGHKDADKVSTGAEGYSRRAHRARPTAPQRPKLQRPTSADRPPGMRARAPAAKKVSQPHAQPGSGSHLQFSMEDNMDMNKAELRKSLISFRGLRKGLYNRVTEWAGQFMGTPLYVEALRCLKEKAQCDKEAEATRAKHKSWRELEELPRSRRQEMRKKQDKAMDVHHQRSSKILAKMDGLEERLLDHQIAEAERMGKGDVDKATPINLPVIKSTDAVVEGLEELFKAGQAAGPFRGPKGGLWADPEHKVPYKPLAGKTSKAGHKGAHKAHVIHHEREAVRARNKGNEKVAGAHLDAADAHKVAMKAKPTTLAREAAYSATKKASHDKDRAIRKQASHVNSHKDHGHYAARLRSSAEEAKQMGIGSHVDKLARQHEQASSAHKHAAEMHGKGHESADDHSKVAAKATSTAFGDPTKLPPSPPPANKESVLGGGHAHPAGTKGAAEHHGKSKDYHGRQAAHALAHGYKKDAMMHAMASKLHGDAQDFHDSKHDDAGYWSEMANSSTRAAEHPEGFSDKPGAKTTREEKAAMGKSLDQTMDDLMKAANGEPVAASMRPKDGKDAQTSLVKKKSGEEEEENGPGDSEHHKDQAMSHLAAAQAHATAHRSAKQLESADGHQKNVEAAQQASEAAAPPEEEKKPVKKPNAIKKGSMVIHLDAEEEILKGLGDSGLSVQGAAQDPYGKYRMAAMGRGDPDENVRAASFEKSGVAGGTIFEGEHNTQGFREGDSREAHMRAQELAQVVEDDPAGFEGQGGLPSWWRDAGHLVNVPVGVRPMVKAVEPPVQILDDSDPHTRAMVNTDPREGQMGALMAYKGAGKGRGTR